LFWTSIFYVKLDGLISCYPGELCQNLGYDLWNATFWGDSCEFGTPSKILYGGVRGKLITIGKEFTGPAIHDSLLQRDEELGMSGVPDLKNSKDSLDVYFIQFSNAVVELLAYHGAEGEVLPTRHTSTSPAIPNSMHACFHLRSEIDLGIY
jgi:hypothetical protein